MSLNETCGSRMMEMYCDCFILYDCLKVFLKTQQNRQMGQKQMLCFLGRREQQNYCIVQLDQ